MDAPQLLDGLKFFPWWVILFLVGPPLFTLFFGNPAHYWKIRRARLNLNKLKTIKHPAHQFGFLRRVDPFVFEEMILTALKDQGYKIRRNRRYTGDGGIDGRVQINGHNTFIQAKRYKSYIYPEHVAEFTALCQRTRRKGLFVHTGRTGQQSRINARKGDIDILSGTRMLDLLTGKHFSPRW